MDERKELFVLVVAGDRTVATTLASVLQAGGFMVGSAESAAISARIAGRMIVDAAVIDLAAEQPVTLDAAIALQRKYPACRIILVCSPSQRDEALMLAEEAAVQCEFLLRPLTRTDLLAEVETAPGVPGNPRLPGWQLQAA